MRRAGRGGDIGRTPSNYLHIRRAWSPARARVRKRAKRTERPSWRLVAGSAEERADPTDRHGASSISGQLIGPRLRHRDVLLDFACNRVRLSG